LLVADSIHRPDGLNRAVEHGRSFGLDCPAQSLRHNRKSEVFKSDQGSLFSSDASMYLKRYVSMIEQSVDVMQ